MDMDKRLADMPVMARREEKLDANYYNVWRRARMQWGSPLRLALPGLKEINMILSDRYWVCVDSVKYDAPVIAWTDMQDQNRTTLHEAIPCHLNYYHFAASAVRARSLQLMEEYLSERLRIGSLDS